MTIKNRISLLPFLFLLLSFPLESSSPLAHAIYIGVIDIYHQATKNQTTITIKVFQDDLKDAIKNAAPSKRLATDSLFFEMHFNNIESYFQQHFQSYINEQLLVLKLKKGERKNDVFWLNFKAKCPEEWQNIKIKANFFMELFPTQSNMLYIQEGEQKRFGRLTKSRESQSFEF